MLLLSDAGEVRREALPEGECAERYEGAACYCAFATPAPDESTIFPPLLHVIARRCLRQIFDATMVMPLSRAHMRWRLLSAEAAASSFLLRYDTGAII